MRFYKSKEGYFFVALYIFFLFTMSVIGVYCARSVEGFAVFGCIGVFLKGLFPALYVFQEYFDVRPSEALVIVSFIANVVIFYMVGSLIGLGLRKWWYTKT